MSIVLSIKFTHMRLAHLHNHIIIRYISKLSPALYHYILENKSQAIIQDIPISHLTNPYKSYHKVYFNKTS